MSGRQWPHEQRGLGAHEGHGADYSQRAQELQKALAVLTECSGGQPAGMTGKAPKGHSAGDGSHDVRSISASALGTGEGWWWGGDWK